MNRRITCLQAKARLNTKEYYLKRIIKLLDQMDRIVDRAHRRIDQNKEAE